jgi:uncharacterized protein
VDKSRTPSGARRWFVSFWRLVRLKWLTVLRLKKTPHDIGLGLSFGVFMGFVPIIPMQSIWAIGLCLLFGGSKIAAFAGAWVSNPVTVPPLFTLCYYIGKFFLPDMNVTFDPALLTLDAFLEQGWRLALILNTGGAALGLPAAVLSYFLGRRFAALYQQRKAGRAVDARSRHGLA